MEKIMWRGRWVCFDVVVWLYRYNGFSYPTLSKYCVQIKKYQRTYRQTHIYYVSVFECVYMCVCVHMNACHRFVVREFFLQAIASDFAPDQVLHLAKLCMRVYVLGQTKLSLINMCIYTHTHPNISSHTYMSVSK